MPGSARGGSRASTSRPRVPIRPDYSEWLPQWAKALQAKAEVAGTRSNGKTAFCLCWKRSGASTPKRAPEIGLSTETLAKELGITAEDDQLGIVVSELCRTGYLEATMKADQMVAPLFFRLSEKGLKVVAGWPAEAGTDLLARLLVLVDERIASAESAEERSKWERLRNAVVGVGRDVASEVLAALAAGAIRGST